MKKMKLWGLALLVLFVSACQDDESNELKSENVVVKVSGLEGRLTTAGAKVVAGRDMAAMPDGFFNEETVTTKSALVDSDVASDVVLSLVGEVSAPTIDGVQVQATHVVVDGNYAYVSYNLRGDAYRGAIDLIDVSDPSLPQLAMEVEFPNMEISAIAIHEGLLYMAGARDVDAYEGVSSPAVLAKMTLDGAMLSDDISYLELAGTTGTDVAVGDSYYYAVSGFQGALASFALTNDAAGDSVVADDLRAVGIDGDKLVLLSGADGIRVYELSSMTESLTIDLPEDVAEAKRTIDFYDNQLLVAEGFDGVGIYSLVDGTVINKLPMTTVDDENIDPSDLVCNAVTTSNEHIFMAEGAAGVVVYSLKGTDLTAPTGLGALSLDGSANYVATGDGYIFVADGTGGLKILQISESQADDEGEYTCSSYPAYTGGSWLNINGNEPQAYSGTATLGGLNVGDQLIWCGSLAVSTHVNVNSGGEFVMIGSLSIGSGNGNVININDKMIVDGSLVIYGNLNINSGGSLEFVGDNSSVYVTGTVKVNKGGEIIGDFVDQGGNVK
ncbi:hypothetical protein [Mangrovibacterium marinum]|uniref:LVIVD repeat-containing protein n=1 Tax=Mangrovibacterium marinum TaxID=1639118 RepID=A0A2T5BYL0_9BACT|nr:hypothetical protein [Mangrovibacterium marinum]PTN07315.1 LVIVD repeat-containing protein [Mangrovibacterium marinum]